MRIIAGALGGRQLEAPKSRQTHPMSQKVRGALFNSLGDITGADVFDAFAGSGALGFEALSRGAARATLIELDKNAYFAIQKNRKTLGLESRCSLSRANVSSWLDTNPNAMFAVVLADPSYANLRLDLLEKVAGRTAENGQFVLSWPGKTDPPSLKNMNLQKTKNYGDAQLIFYRRQPGTDDGLDNQRR